MRIKSAKLLAMMLLAIAVTASARGLDLVQDGQPCIGFLKDACCERGL